MSYNNNSDPYQDYGPDDHETAKKIGGIIVTVLTVLAMIALIGGVYLSKTDPSFGKDEPKNERTHRDRDRDDDDDDRDNDDDDDDRPHSGTQATHHSNNQPQMSDMDQALADANAGSGEITVSLIWYNSDDIDLHVNTPQGEIYYGNRNLGGGTLDVDANFDVMMEMPVENIYFTTAPEGSYSIWIEDYTDRNDGYASYMVRITVNGFTRVYEGHIDGSGTDIDIANFNYQK